MSAGVVVPIIRRLWSVWNIRGFMILSLTIQLVLALAAPLRKKTSNFIVISTLWSAYFLADWTAIFAFGLISNAGCSKSPSYMEVTGDLLALWASFLLIHLGGPDTITAFSLEDNALWLRHLVGLIAQVFAFLYIFVKTLPDNKLMAPIVLVFATGVIKYGERSRALYLASLKNLKVSSIKSLYQPDHVNLAGTGPDEEASSKEEMLNRAIHFFHNIKGLIVDIMPNHSKWLESREFFLKQDADSVFDIIVTELNLLYEAFYTKIIAVNSSWGVCIRNIAYYMSVTAFILFCLNKKDGLQAVDIWITYALLVGVIAIHTSSEIMLLSSRSKKDLNIGNVVLGMPLLITALIYGITISPLIFCRCGFVVKRLWSGKMGSFNLLVYGFEEGRSRRGCMLERCCRAIFGAISETIGIAEEIAKMRHTSKIGMIYGIWKYTFSVLHKRASDADEPNKVREINEARGELALRDSSNELKRYVTEFEYDQSILLWHIATEICYCTERNLDKDDENVKFSKILSDYVIYLMVKQPDMMSPVADIFHKRYQDTCGELKRLEQRVRAVTLEEFCLKVLEEYGGGIEPAHQDGNIGASALINSCSLAMLLAQTERKWEIICTVWVELLSYAAGHCRVDSHARLVSEGGEFVTFVWLLMAHFGIGPRFPKN